MPKSRSRNKRPQRPRRIGSSYRRRVVVKFVDRVGLPYDGTVDQFLDRMQIGPWHSLVHRHPGISIRPLFGSIPTDRLGLLAQLGERNDQSYRAPDFLSYFVISLPRGVGAREVVREISTWRSVQFAYFDPPGQDPLVQVGDPRLRNYHYLGPNPAGINSDHALMFQGGDGSGQHFVDLELGWTRDHQDLVGLGIKVLFGQVCDSSRPHGTSVVSIVCGASNLLGGRGIAQGVDTADVVSYSDDEELVPQAIVKASDALPKGGVLLLEVQKSYRPTELLKADYEAIRNATARGIIVIEAGGNGGYDLDNSRNVENKLVLNTGDPNYQDSGAVVVGAATAKHPHERMSYSNYGSRVDCYAWGENVYCATSNDKSPFETADHVPDFDGTSSASAIIAGAALAVQGMSAAAGRPLPLTSRELRGLFRQFGTAPASQVKRIGLMPNLRAIIESGQIGVVPPLLPGGG